MPRGIPSSGGEEGGGGRKEEGRGHAVRVTALGSAECDPEALHSRAAGASLHR